MRSRCPKFAEKCIVVDQIKRLAREPLLHFLAIGACIYGAYAFFGAEPEQQATPETIRVTAGEVAWMADSWTTKWGRPPTEQELLGMIRDRVRETAYYREALAMGLDKDDVIIRRRLTQKLEFLTDDLATAKPPNDEKLKAYFQQHRDQYRPPDLITFTHVFVDPDKRGDATLDDARALKAELVARGEAAVGEGHPLGDRLMLQNYYPERSQSEISKLFGSGFAQSLFELESGTWQGPVLSGYGTHLVFVHDLATAPAPKFTTVKQRVLQDWDDQQRKEFNKKFTARLLSRYQVVVELEDDQGNVEDISVGMGMPRGAEQATENESEGEEKVASREQDEP